jgi:ribosomal RNA-processing protein 12
METFERVTAMLESALAEQQPKQQKDSADKVPPTSHTLMDLVVTISIYLPRSSFGTLFALASTVLNQESADPQLIKKAYKLIPRLATSESGSAALEERSSDLQTLFISTADKTPSPARRDRLLAIHEVISFLPTSDLHFIPSILSEVVLGCKETNEKARTAAFTLLVHLANRIIDPERNPPGTVIRNSLAPHMADDAPDGPATIEEFFTMVSAGLAGTSPHMVAASITALSRLLFEYHTKLTPSMLSDMVQTIDLFLTSNNREIVRAVLGFVKVAVVVLPEDLLRPRLASLVPNLLVWSKEHKGRLKSKVKGIIDRLIRRFGSPVIEGLAGDADRKFVVAIRKERERKKKKNAGPKADDDEGEEDEADERAKPGERIFSNAFDKAIYGSDSDLSGSDSDDASELEVDATGNTHRMTTKGKKSKSKRGQGDERYIRELSPESNPLDLLAPNALASISSTKPAVRFLADRKKKKHSARVDAEGKLLIGTDDSGAGRDQDGDTAMDTASGNAADSVNAYVAAVSGPDAVRRGQKGRLKVSQSGVGKKAAAAADEMDVDSDGESRPAAARSTGTGGRGGGGIAAGRRGLGVPKTSKPNGGRIEKRRKDFKVGSRGSRGRGGGRSGSGFRAGGRK